VNVFPESPGSGKAQKARNAEQTQISEQKL